MRTTIFGLGYVGAVTAACLASRGHEVTGVDSDPAKVGALAAGHPPVIEPDLDDVVAAAVSSGRLCAVQDGTEAVRSGEVTLVCVGTPSLPDGSTDLSPLRRVVEQIGQALAGQDDDHTVVIRSTVPPGTVSEVVAPLLQEASGRLVGKSLHVAMCPEFLREGSSVQDFFHPPFVILGGSARATDPLRRLFDFLDSEVHVVPTEVAEGLKYSCNAFHALKVVFANEIARLYRGRGVDARAVMELFVRDTDLNISPSYLRPGFAFGGSCLPKDVRSLLHMARAQSCDVPVLLGILTSNESVIREAAERVVRRVEEVDPQGRRVALLGLSFKPQTDDLRESPNVALAEYLLGKGLDLRIYDPVVNPSTLFGANLRHVQQRLPHLHRLLVDSAAEAVADASVVVLSNADQAALCAVRTARPSVVLDLHGRFGAQIEQLAGYEGMGW